MSYRKLRKLRVNDMQHIRELPLVILLLQEHLPHLHVEGVDWNVNYDSDVTSASSSPFLAQSRSVEEAMLRRMVRTQQLGRREATRIQLEQKSSSPLQLKS